MIDELKEGALYAVENLNFRPDEHSYVEPWIEPEDPNKPKEEEKTKKDLKIIKRRSWTTC